ncbi:hypothetical protein EN935_19215, partial [Mesorhizobium sp. M7D.F.Ca.US.004.03.1.1]
MKFLGNKATVMPLMAITATLAFGVPQAGAQGLFDMLFGGGVKRAPQGEFPPPPPKHKPKAPAGAGGGGVKISSPSYYTYKADRLVRIDFSALTAAPQPAT